MTERLVPKVVAEKEVRQWSKAGRTGVPGSVGSNHCRSQRQIPHPAPTKNYLLLYVQLFIYHLHFSRYHKQSREDLKCMGGCV